MQNINTTYSLFNNRASSFGSTETDNTVTWVPLKNFGPQIPLKKQYDVTGFLVYSILFLVIFAIIRLRGKNLILLLTNVLLKRKKFEIIQTEGVTQNIIYYLLALTLSFSSLAIGAVYLTEHGLNLESVFYIFGFLFLYHFLILGFIRLTSWTFNARYTGEEAAINLWAYNIMTGLFTAPFIIAAFFVKAFAIELLAKIIVICLILFYIVKIIRWIEILLVHRVSILYMILYLCALEVIPLLVLYKIMV